MKKLLFFLFSAFIIQVHAQFKVLVFHKTNGWRHSDAITEGIKMFEELGAVNSDPTKTWTVDNTQDASVFTTTNLAQYEVIIFANTSGGGLLDANQKSAMQQFIQGGKGFIGIHAATDTYRGTDANSTWQWYNELVGGIVQTNPNHTSQNFPGTMNILTNSDITIHVGNQGSTWNHNEEWYYWEQNGGWLYPNNMTLLEVQSTGGQTYDATRPITWYKQFDGGRSFYTALGHSGNIYKNTSSNADFREMMRKAVLWAANELVVVDNCPNDPNKIEPGLCGCGVADTPNCGVPFDIEGFIEAEDFSDKTSTIRIEPDGINGNLGFITNGSFVEYDINVLQAGTYELTMSASAGPSAGGSIEFLANGNNAGSLTVNPTSGWQDYDNFITTLNFPTTGLQTLRLNFSCPNAFALNYDNMDFKFLVSTGVKEFSLFSLEVFPNPAQDEVQIETPKSIVNDHMITVFNTKMQPVLVIDGKEENRLDISNLPSGIYHVRIDSGKDVEFGMFVKE